MALTKVKAGNIILTTPSSSSNDTTPATTQYVTTAINDLIDTAPSTLNTLNELAAALGDDVNFSTTVTNSIATKLPLAGGTLTGTLTVAGSSSGTVDALIITNTDTTNNGLSIGVDSSENAFFWNGSNTSMNFATNNTLKMVIDATGNVGIGNSSPSSLYWPNGSTGGLFLQAGGLLSAYNAGTNLSQNWYYNSGEKFIGNGGASRYVQSGQEHIWSHSTAVNSSGAGAGLTWSESMRIDSSGNVDLYQGNNLTWRYAAGSTIRGSISVSSADDMTFNNGSSNAERMRITGDGDVSIGSDHSGFSGWRVLNLRGEAGSGALINWEANNATRKAAIAQSGSDLRLQVFDNGSITFEPGTGAERMRLDSSGNLGLGVVPTANWWANATALQISPTAAMWNTSNYEDFNIGNNIYTDGTEKYLQNDAACKIRLTDSGLMDFRVAGAGTAGSAISYITAMAIDSAGVVIIDASQGKAAGKHDMEIGNASKAHGVFLRPYMFFGTRYSAWDTNLGWNAESDAMTTGSGIVQGTSYGGSGASNLIVGADTLSWYRWAPAQCTGSGASLAVSSTYLYMQASTSGFNIKGSYLSNASDRRLKDNITPITNALDKVKQLTGNTFTWKTTIPASGEPIPEHKAGKADMGVIAQEVQEVVPTAVQLSPWDSHIKEVDNPNFNGDLETGGPQKISDPNGFTSVTGENYLTVNEEKLVPLLIEAIKELEARVAELEG